MEMNSKENVPSGLETYSKGELMGLREFTGEVGTGDERSENGYSVIRARIFVSKLISLPSSENSQAIHFYRGNDNLFASLFYNALGDVMNRIAIVGEKSSRWDFPDNVALRKFIDQYRDYSKGLSSPYPVTVIYSQGGYPPGKSKHHLLATDELAYPTDSFLEKLVQKYPLPHFDIKAPLLLSACNDNVVEGKVLSHPRFMILHRVGLAEAY